MTVNYREYDGPMTDEKWIELARDSYRSSTDYLDSSLRRQWERNYDLFRNRHPAGSKYNSDAYRKRSRNFRPKTRSVIRKNEAAAAIGFFSTADGADVKPLDDTNPKQQLSAAINKELVNYRLDSDDMHWFLKCIGAYQDAMTVGLVISKQVWRFKTESQNTSMPLVDEAGNPILDEDGRMQFKNVKRKKIIEDRPEVMLIPADNLRIDPAADWTDPINTSPFVIHLIPMYVHDVFEMTGNEDGVVSWRRIEEEDVQKSHSKDMYYDSIRRRREGTERIDSKEVDTAIKDFDIVWVHENFVRWRGRDWVYFTLGTEVLISEPIPREELYLHCAEERPFVIGYSQIEAHRPFPSGVPELVEGLQISANDLENQRRDNVNLVLNKRYYMRRGARVDVSSLVRNVPGSVTAMEDINTDIRTESTPDVTSSAYAEQDRINADFDELAGNFSTGSVGTARNMNETVGGMKMLKEGSSDMIEYQLRIFSETWTEPVIRQLVKLEQAYETDQKILQIAGARANIKQYHINTVADYMIQGDFTTKVGVGFGSTDPQKKVEKIGMGMQVVGQLFPQVLAGADPAEFVKEVFGALGYRDGTRFFPQLKQQQEDPRIAEMQQAIEELQRIIETKQIENQTKIQVEGMRQEGAAADREAEVVMNADKLGVQAAEKMLDAEARKNANADTQKTKLAQTAMELTQDSRKFAQEMQVKRQEGVTANYGLE